MKKGLILLSFLSSFLEVSAQKDRVIVRPIEHLIERAEFTIFKNDTFNQVDANHLIKGKGIQIVKLETRYKGMTSHVWYTDRGCTSEKEPDVIVQSIQYISYGRYEQNQKVGIWTVYWNNGAKKLELTYEKDQIVGVTKIYDEAEHLIYQGIVNAKEPIVALEKMPKTGVLRILNWYVDDLYALNW